MKKKIELELNKKYREGLKELEKEIEKESPGWIKKRRSLYLKEQMIECLEHLMPFYEYYDEATERNVDYLIKRIVGIFAKYEYWEKRINKFWIEYKFTILKKSGENKITSDIIERAREYPIKDIIEVNKNNFALCLFHDDRHPSLYCKNNFFHCFSCGKSGSVIDLYMKKHNVDFVTAVKFLSR